MNYDDIIQLDIERREALEADGRHQDAVGYLPCLCCGGATMSALCVYCEEGGDDDISC